MPGMGAKAIPPFDNPDADIILRSSDRPHPTEFRAFKFLLSLASPFFATAFTLLQPPDDGSEEVPVMEMQENARTLRAILGFCYPISVHPLPRLTTLKDVRVILQAAEKFEMKGIQNHIQETLVDEFLEDNPVSVFAIACHYGWQKIVDQAAYRFLALPITASADEAELELISAATYYRLLWYRQECGEVAKNEVVRVEAIRREGVLGATLTAPWGAKPTACSDKSRCMGVANWWKAWILKSSEALKEIPGRSSIDTEIPGPICKICKNFLLQSVQKYEPLMLSGIKKKISAVQIGLDLVQLKQNADH